MSEPAIDWNMVEALGTIFAACVVVFFGLRDVLERYLNKPRIVLEHSTARNIGRKKSLVKY